MEAAHGQAADNFSIFSSHRRQVQRLHHDGPCSSKWALKAAVSRWDAVWRRGATSFAEVEFQTDRAGARAGEISRGVVHIGGSSGPPRPVS